MVTPEKCFEAADIVLVLDETGSSTSQQTISRNWNDLLRFVANVVNAFSVSPSAARFGAVVYGQSVRIAFRLDRYSRKVDVIDAVRNLRRNGVTGGGSNMAAALRTTRANVFGHQSGARRALVAKIILLITDGDPTLETRQTIPEADRAKADGTEIFVVGITSYINAQLLRRVATSSSHFYNGREYSGLGGNLEPLVNHMCRAIRDYVRSTTPSITTSTSSPTMTTTTTISTPTMFLRGMFFILSFLLFYSVIQSVCVSCVKLVLACIRFYYDW